MILHCSLNPTQTDGNGIDNEAILQDMRQYYLATVRSINKDVLQHIAKTKECAAANLRYFTYNFFPFFS